MDNLFHVVDDGFVITHSRGVYRQCQMYRRGKTLYAKVAGGFVRLLARGGTTALAISWDHIELPPGLKLGEGKLQAPMLVGQ